MWARLAHVAMALCLSAAVGGCAEMSRRDVSPDLILQRRANAQASQEFSDGMDALAELNYDEAESLFRRAAVRFDEIGDRKRAAEATFWFAYCSEKLSRNSEARQLYRRVLQLYPDSPAAEQARRRLAALEPIPEPS